MSQGDCDAALAAQAQARQDIAKAQSALNNLTGERAAVANGSQSELSSGAKSTESALNKSFGDSSASTIKSVESTLSKVDKVLADDGSRYQFTNFDVPGYLGKAIPYGAKINLTDSYFNLRSSDKYRTITLIHEAGHLVGQNFLLPEAYGGAAKWAPTWYHLRNADDIAIFANGFGN